MYRTENGIDKNFRKDIMTITLKTNTTLSQIKGKEGGTKISNPNNSKHLDTKN